MIDPYEQMRPRIQRPHAHDALGDFRGFLEHFELMIFRGEKIEPRVRAAMFDRNLRH